MRWGTLSLRLQLRAQEQLPPPLQAQELSLTWLLVSFSEPLIGPQDLAHLGNSSWEIWKHFFVFSRFWLA